MKTLLLLFLFTTLNALANDYGITYPRDNTFCQFDNRIVEIKIRGFDQYTQMTEGFYGERLFLLKENKKIQIQTNDNGIGRYRLVQGGSEHCGKALSIKVARDEIAIFLAKDNRPFPDTLSVLYFNFSSGLYEMINTSRPVTEAFVKENKLNLKLKSDPCKITTGKTIIDDQLYQYAQSDFESWSTFDGSHFVLDRAKTFNHYDGKKFYSSEEDFFSAKGDHSQVKIAVNHQLKRKCLSFGPDGSWKCTTMP